MIRENIENFLIEYQPKDDAEIKYKEEMLKFLSENDIVYGKENKNGHFTGSGWVINKTRTKVLLCYHRKLDKWFQLGGHSEIDENIIDTALREVREESGLESVRLILNRIFDIDIHEIPEYKSEISHYHYDIRFVFEADDSERIKISNESKDVAWVNIEDVGRYNGSDSVMRMVEKISKVKK